MTLQLFIVRHGQPAYFEPGYSGAPNPPLSQIGEQQAELTGKQFAEWGTLDALYSSAMRRAVLTAAAIHRHQPAPWSIWAALAEAATDIWLRTREWTVSGKYAAFTARAAAHKAAIGEHYPTLSELGAQYPVSVEQPFSWDDVWQPSLEGETREISYLRARLMLQALLKRHGGSGRQERIAVVCHGAFASILLTELLKSEPSDYGRYHFSHSAIARVDVGDDGSTVLNMLNYVAHLPAGMVTEGLRLV